jgi:hypothetical protein
MESCRHVKRTLLALAVALVLAASIAPLALAADDQVGDPTPAPVVDPTPEPTPTPFVNGEPVADPTFITASPTATPAGAVKGLTGRHSTVTPPPTDTIDGPTATGTDLQVLLVLAVGFALALLVAPVPARRRR